MSEALTKQGLKTVSIKGKLYVDVSERIRYFREHKEYNEWSLESEFLKLDEKFVVIKAIIKNKEGRIIAEGTAYETAGSNYINKTSYIENCETSAWGRALGNLGIGIDVSLASADEVKDADNKNEQQEKAAEEGSTSNLLEVLNTHGIDKEAFKKFANVKTAKDAKALFDDKQKLSDAISKFKEMKK